VLLSFVVRQFAHNFLVTVLSFPLVYGNSSTLVILCYHIIFLFNKRICIMTISFIFFRSLPLAGLHST
jgi:hypothetical protein